MATPPRPAPVGYEVAFEDCRAQTLEKRLKAKGPAIDVLKAGVSVHSKTEEYLYLKRELLNYQPDAP